MYDTFVDGRAVQLHADVFANCSSVPDGVPQREWRKVLKVALLELAQRNPFVVSPHVSDGDADLSAAFSGASLTLIR